MELKEEQELLSVEEIEAALEKAEKKRNAKLMRKLVEILKAQQELDAAYKRKDFDAIERCEALLWRLDPVSLGLSPPSGEPPNDAPSASPVTPAPTFIDAHGQVF
jgi:hypothetical protein